MNNLPKIGIPIIIVGLIVLVVLFKSFVTIPAGSAGVVYNPLSDGVDVDAAPLGEGLHLIAPWNDVIEYSVRTQQVREQMQVLSSNGLNITLEASAWYRPIESELGALHKTISEDYLQRILQPALRSAARSVVGRYTPEQLYSSKRDAIQSEIEDETRALLEGQHINLEKILVRDVTLPKTIVDAIERKLRQEQESLEYEFRLTKATKEAERQRIEAEGKAAANTIIAQSLTQNVLTEKGIQATLELSKSPNSKVVVVGGGEGGGLPLILGDN